METTPRKPRRRWLLAAALGLIGLCVLAVAALLVFNALQPQATAEPAQLSADQAAFMAESIHLQAELGGDLWPGFAAARIPQLSFSETHAFLCGYPGSPPEEWEPIETQVAGEPCYRRPWSDGQNFTLPVGERWAGSMITQEWGKIKLRRDLSEMMPAPLAAVIGPFFTGVALQPYRYVGALVHESFHAYQAEAARPHFDDAERAYPDEAAYWQADAGMHAAWEAEIEALYRAATGESDEEARRLAQEFLELRQARRRDHLAGAPNLVQYEQRYEWLEGLAKYIELNALLLACRTPGYEPVEAVRSVGGFNGYCAAESFYAQELDQMKRQAAREGDTRFYYTGMAQAQLLDRFAPGWKAAAFDGERLEDLLRAAFGP